MTSKRIYYTVYETTNLVNKKKYRGVHRTTNPNDRYFGSGNALKKAIKKYGKHNFKKEILFVAFDDKGMYWAEKQLADEVWLKNRNTYNLVVGGFGSSIKSEETHKRMRAAQKGKKHRPESIEKMSRIKMGELNSNYGKRHSEETKEKIRRKALGRKYSQERKDRMSKATKGKIMWITNDKITKMVSINSKIPSGWRKGRLPTSDKTKEKLSKAGKGRIPTEETRKKISKALIGHHVSQETKNKIGEASRRYHNGTKRKIWITNGKESLMIIQGDPIPFGYRKGRTYIKKSSPV